MLVSSVKSEFQLSKSEDLITLYLLNPAGELVHLTIPHTLCVSLCPDLHFFCSPPQIDILFIITEHIRLCLNICAAMINHFPPF